MRNKIPKISAIHLPQLKRLDPIRITPKTVRVKTSSGGIVPIRLNIKDSSRLDADGVALVGVRIKERNIPGGFTVK